MNKEWEGIDTLELLKMARRMHKEIFDMCEKSKLPVVLLVGILESVKQQLYAVADVEWTE